MPRPRRPRAAPTCASSSDLLLVSDVGGLKLVRVRVAPVDVNAFARLDRRPVVRSDDRQPLAEVGVDEDAAERADEDDVGDRRGNAGAVQLDPLGTDGDATTVAL